MAATKKAKKGGAKRTKKAAGRGTSRTAKKKAAAKAPKRAGGKAAGKAAGKSAKKSGRKGAKAVSAAKSRKPAAAKKSGRAASKKVSGTKARRSRKGTSVAKKTKRSFEKIKETLLTRREQLLANLGKLTGSSGSASDRPVGDRVDDAVNDLEVDSSYAIAEQEVEELKIIDAALENIEDGTYGICEECGQPIGKPRLRALPYAVLCLKCKEEEEMERAASGGF